MGRSRPATFYLLVGICLGMCPSLVLYGRLSTTGWRTGDAPSSDKGELLHRRPDAGSSYKIPTVKDRHPSHAQSHNSKSGNPQRKILLDCGANVASTVQLFRETYPEGQNYIIHSFEIDDRLTPYFKPYSRHRLHCPVGVAGRDGNMTAYSEKVWSPQKGLNSGTDMQWGGGSLFVSNPEKVNNDTGGFRHLSYRKTIPVIDLSRWIRETVSHDDYVILKLDVEGAEYDILSKFLRDNTFDYIDKFYGEYHSWQPTGYSQAVKEKLVKDVEVALGYPQIPWDADKRNYGDFEEMNPINIPQGTPGSPGATYSKCTQEGAVSLVVEIGMNLKRAHKLVSTLGAHQPTVPIALFVYGDFAEQHPDIVRSWAKRFFIGMREDGPCPAGHFALMSARLIRMALVSAIRRLTKVGVSPGFYLPSVTGADELVGTMIADAAEARGLRIVVPAVTFPPKKGSVVELTMGNYYQYRDVERVPKALRAIHKGLATHNGGILSLDADLPDSYMYATFLLDYLQENSGYKLLHFEDCIPR